MGDPRKGKQVEWDGVLAFLIVLRIAPFPPHWVANFVAPHLDIGPLLFFSSVFVGMSDLTVVRVRLIREQVSHRSQSSTLPSAHLSTR